ncbi:MAG TPA: phosphate/phosphite/phosphonate ABC transporter substrate-binding protein [Vicinamibacterales bacterium]
MTSPSTNGSDLVLGAVAYDQKVVPIWDGFLHYFGARGLPFDYVLFSNYERQVEAQIRGSIHVAWHSPLAWLQTERIAASLGWRAEAIAMRDTDRDLRSVILVRADGGIGALTDLRRTIVAVGARDSPQATLIPLNHLAHHGLVPERDFQVRVFDALVGKHGDHIGGERDAVRALVRGEADAACILDANHLAFAREGTLAPASVRVLTQTESYDHCNVTVVEGVEPEKVARFRELLLAMSYADPEVRPLLDLEGLKAWVPGRVTGYAQLAEAVDRFGTIDAFVTSVGALCK